MISVGFNACASRRVLEAAVQSAVSEADGAVDARAAIAVASIPLDDAPAQSLADGLLVGVVAMCQIAERASRVHRCVRLGARAQQRHERRDAARVADRRRNVVVDREVAKRAGDARLHLRVVAVLGGHAMCVVAGGDSDLDQRPLGYRSEVAGADESAQQNPPPAAREAVELCGRSPLLLAMAGAMIEKGTRRIAAKKGTQVSTMIRPTMPRLSGKR